VRWPVVLIPGILVVDAPLPSLFSSNDPSDDRSTTLLFVPAMAPSPTLGVPLPAPPPVPTAADPPPAATTIPTTDDPGALPDPADGSPTEPLPSDPPPPQPRHVTHAHLDGDIAALVLQTVLERLDHVIAAGVPGSSPVPTPEDFREVPADHSCNLCLEKKRTCKMPITPGVVEEGGPATTVVGVRASATEVGCRKCLLVAPSSVRWG